MNRGRTPQSVSSTPSAPTLILPNRPLESLEDDDEDVARAGNHSNLVISGGGEEGQSDPKKWFSGCVPLGLEDDKYWLSELQVYLRANFAEAFGATEEDIAAPMHGRNKPIALGQVGIRCMHCKRELFGEIS